MVQKCVPLFLGTMAGGCARHRKGHRTPSSVITNQVEQKFWRPHCHPQLCCCSSGSSSTHKGGSILGLLCLSCSKPAALCHVIWAAVALPVGIEAGRAPHLGQPGDTGGHNSCTPQHVPR